MESLKLTQKTTPVKQEVELTFNEVLNLKNLIENTSYSLPSNHSPMCFLQEYPPYNKIDIIEDRLSSLEKNSSNLQKQVESKADKSEFCWPKWEKWNWENHLIMGVFLLTFSLIFAVGLSISALYFICHLPCFVS